MMHDDEHPKDDGKAPVWLLTFGDVTALLLTFFVMLFATTKIPSETWEAVIGPMSDNLQFAKAGRTPNPEASQAIPIVDPPVALPTEYLTAVMADHLGQDEILQRAIVRRLDGQVVISLFGDALFVQGESALAENARESIFRLGGVIANIGNQLEVIGHADPTNADGADFDANWLLSLNRAVAVADELRASGYQRNIIALGLGDSRYSHLDQTIEESRRLELARRVDLVLHGTAEER